MQKEMNHVCPGETPLHSNLEYVHGGCKANGIPSYVTPHKPTPEPGCWSEDLLQK